jgi:hypothetical protein
MMEACMTLYRAVYLGVNRIGTPINGTRTTEADDIDAANQAFDESLKEDGIDVFLLIVKRDGVHEVALRVSERGASKDDGNWLGGSQRAGEEPI